MGTHLSKNKLDLPTVRAEINRQEINSIITKTFTPKSIRIAEDCYDIYSLMDLKIFLEYVVENRFYHIANSSALLMMAREKLWYAQVAKNPGSTFGYLAGTIKLSDTQQLEEANFYIDLEHRPWVINPKDGKVYPPTSQMNIDFVLI